MSWLIETLLLNRADIKVEPDFESDDYNNLLLVEKAITELVKDGYIEPFELAILNYVSTNKSYTELENILGISRNTLSKYFRGIADRISFSLGHEFTDEGYLSYMQEKHRLSEEDVEKMRDHINSRYRHTIRRKTDDDK